MRSQLNEKVVAPVWKADINGRGDPVRGPSDNTLPENVGTNFADK
jgi:hypothetical protein